jgi:hypothetical protein
MTLYVYHVPCTFYRLPSTVHRLPSTEYLQLRPLSPSPPSPHGAALVCAFQPEGTAPARKTSPLPMRWWPRARTREERIHLLHCAKPSAFCFEMPIEWLWPFLGLHRHPRLDVCGDQRISCKSRGSQVPSQSACRLHSDRSFRTKP